MNLVIALLVGAALSGGLLLLAAGLRRGEAATPRASRGVTWAGLTRRPPGPAGRRRDLILAAASIVGVLVAALTGWVVAVVLVPLLALGLPALLATPVNRDIEVLEDLHAWVRSLAAMMPTGLSMIEAVRSSQRSAPERLRLPLARLNARLEARSRPRDALMGFADELRSADVDAVVAALVLGSERGGTGATAIMIELADSLQIRLRALHEIEAERSKPRIVVRQISMITVLVLAAALTFGHGYFEPYRSPTGQAILAVLLGCYVAALVKLRRMTLPRQRPRILIAAGATREEP